MAKNKKATQDADVLLQRFSKAYVAALKQRKAEIQIESPILGNKAQLIDNPWPMYERFYNNIHYQDNNHKMPWRSAPKSSKPIQAVETITTLITDQPARVEFLPVDSNDNTVAVKLARAFDWWRARTAWDIAHTMAVRDSRKFSVGWLCLERDEEAPLMQSIMCIPADQMLVSPNTTFQDFIVGKMPDYLIYTTTAQYGELKTRYPDADWGRFSEGYSPDTEATNKNERIMRAVLNDQIDDPTLPVSVYEFWLRDDSKTVFTEDIAGDYEAQLEKPLYPNGRRIVIAGGVILIDEENPYDHGRTPFVPIVSYPQSNRFYSHSDIGLVLTDTVMADDQTRILADAVYKSGGGKLMINTSVIKHDPDEINNDVAQKIEVSDVNNAMRWLDWPSPPRFLIGMIDKFNQNADDAVGSHDISRGIYTPGNKTASEIGVLAESDRTRVRAAVRVIGKVNETLARMWLSNLTQFSDWQTYIRITNEEDGAEQAQVVSFGPEDLTRTNEYSNTDTDEIIQFDISVVDGSTMPTRAQDQFMQMIDLFDRGIVDKRAVLEVSNIPGWRTILTRIEQREQQAMAAQGAMQGEMPMGAPMEAPMEEPAPEELESPEEVAAPMGEEEQVVEFLLSIGVPESEINDQVIDAIIDGDINGVPPEMQSAIQGALGNV